MNRIKRAGVVVLVVLAMGFSSCEKEGLPELDGVVTINFKLSDLSYEADEVRSADRVRMEPETVVVPVERDLHLYATLEEDEGTPLRAPGDLTLAVNTLLQIVAYRSSDNAYVSNAEYRVSTTGGAIVPVSASGLNIPAGSYKFVAYSLNATTSPPAYAATITGLSYSPNTPNDPLWGISASAVAIVEGNNNVTLSMKHLFSRVSVKATTTDFSGTPPTISAMSAQFAGYKATGWTPWTGALTKGAAEGQAFGTFTSLGTTTVTCPQRMVYGGGESTTSITLSATIGGTARSALIARFNQQLAPGKSYTLRISFKKLSWARSNIYWDGNRLTFVPAGSDTSKEGYLGVLFKWGSLVGIEPGASNGNGFSTTTQGVYEPTYNSTPTSSTWAKNASHSYTTAGWPVIASGVAENGAINIPYFDGSAAFNTSENSLSGNYAIQAAQNTPERYAARRGDICQYIGATTTDNSLKGYRLPTASEFGQVDDNPWNKDGWVSSNSASGNSGSFEGQGNVRFRAQNTIMDVVLPATGCRWAPGGVMYSLFDGGHYWTGSADGSLKAYYTSFSAMHLSISYSQSRDFAFSIRCIKN